MTRLIPYVWGAGLLCLMRPLAISADLDFYRDIYPVLKANCISCHNKTTTKAGLNMESPELMKKGGESGPAVVAGKSAESLVVQAAAHQEDYWMPPKNNKSGAVDLTRNEIALLKDWIDQGAKHSIPQARRVAWQPLPPGVNPIYTVAMTKDGRFAACGRANQIFIYDLATRQFVTHVIDQAGVAHRALVQSLAFSPDGTRLASGSFREVKIWRQENTGAVTRKCDPALGVVASTLSRDGGHMLCADKEGALHLLETVSGKIIKSISGVNMAGIKLLSLSPDGSAAAVYGSDATLSLWNLQEDKRITTQAGVNGVRAMAWTRDGKAIVTGSEDKCVRVWSTPTSDTAEFDVPKEFKGAKGIITAVEPTATGDRLLVASDDGQVRLWSLADNKIVREFAITGVSALASSTDGRQFAAGSGDGAVRVWEIEAGKQTAELRGDMESSTRLAALDWAAAAQALEIDFQTKEVARIQAENKALDELLKKANDTVASVRKILPEKQKAVPPATEEKLAAQKAADAAAALIANAPEGKPDAALEKQNKEAQDKLVAATMAETAAIGAVTAAENHIKDAEAEAERSTAAKNRNDNEITAANAAIALAKQNQAKTAADLAGARQALAKAGPRALAVAFSKDGQSVAALSEDGVERVWALASGLPVEQLSIGAAMTGASLAAAAEGGFFACSADGASASGPAGARWSLERVLGSDKADGPFVDRVNTVRFSPDGQTLAVGGGEPSRSGDISLWEVATGRQLKTWAERHADAVLCLDFSPDGKLLASGGADKIARVTDIASGKQVALFEGHTHHVMDVAFRADGRELASAGGDGVVLVWDMINGERKKKIIGWNAEVTSLRFIGATPQIVTSAGDKQIRIVNDEGTEVRAMAKLPDFMQAAASTATGNVIIGGGEDGLLRVWDGTNGKELATFGAK